MARRNPPAKWVLPEVVDPDRLCIQIEVPNDPAHIAAFRGALLELASAYKWADDSAHTAKDVALVWRDIIDNMGNWGCSMLTDVRQSSTLPCVLEKELSGEWQPFANLRYCPPNLRISGGKIQYFDEGTQTWVDYPTNTGGSAPGSQPGSQPGGDQPVPAGECKEIVLTVQANGITIVPFRVIPGDTVLITEITGGWTHDIGSWPAIGWYCGTGKAFVLGACGSTDGPDGDLIATLPVGRLICQYGSNFFDAQTLYELPAEWDEDLLALRMNDSAYANNSGSVTCKVEICSGQWSHTFDFTASDGGFYSDYASGYLGVWTTGVGWEDQFKAGWRTIEIYKTFTESTITSLELEWYGTAGSENDSSGDPNWQASAAMWANNARRAASSNWNTMSPTTITWSGEIVCSRFDLRLIASQDAGGQDMGGSVTAVRVTVTGKGSNPFV